jgi:hypothetical protein
MTFFLGVVVQRNLSKQINSLLSWNLRLELCVVCRDCPVFCRDPRTEAAAFHHIYLAKLVLQRTSSTRSGPRIDSSSFVLTTSALLVPFEGYL